MSILKEHYIVNQKVGHIVLLLLYYKKKAVMWVE
jgi:hypothetical protein